MIVSRGFYSEGTTSRGLELLHNVLFKIKDHMHLVSTIQEQISMPLDEDVENILDSVPQSIRRRQYPSDWYLKEQRRDPLLLQGDDEERPPLAWTLIWRGTYSNLFGWYINDVIRFWGYIMWDAARLECTGARGVLIRQWEAHWGDFDPRDNP